MGKEREETFVVRNEKDSLLEKTLVRLLEVL